VKQSTKDTKDNSKTIGDSSLPASNSWWSWSTLFFYWL